MIIQEIINENLVRTYSDKHVLIHGGFPEGDYIEAVDPVELHRTYTETDIPIEDDTPSEGDSTEAEQLLNILLGENQ